MGIRITNRWCAPQVVDLGPPLGKTRLSKALPTELDIDFNDLQLPPRAAAMVAKGTILIEDTDLPEAPKPAGDTTPQPKPDAKPAPGSTPPPVVDDAPAGVDMPADRIAELRILAAGDKRSPTTRKAIEMLEAAGIPLQE